MGIYGFNFYLSVCYPYGLAIAVTNAGVDEFTGVAYTIGEGFEFKLVILLGAVGELGAVGVVGKELGTILILYNTLFLHLALLGSGNLAGTTTY